jgi:hypothetical protein
MKSSTLKRITICILLLFVGVIWWYLLANHQHHKRPNKEFFPHRHNINSIFEDSFNEFEQREKEMNDLFNDMENNFFEDWRNKKNSSEIISWDNSQSKWSFQFYQKTSKNWKDTSYEINWNWNEDESTWIIIMSWINTDWKEFSFSWKMQNGKSEWIMQDNEWHSKAISFENININDILENSNNITE